MIKCFEKMRSMILVVGTITFVLIGMLPREMNCRAIDDLDNRIESNDETNHHNHRTLFETKDWVKIVKAPPKKVVQTLDSPIELICEVMGAPLPTIKWVRGDLLASGVDKYKLNVLSETSPTSIVRVRSILVIDHILPNERTYTCIGQSSGQTVFASTTIYPSTELSKLQDLEYLAALNEKSKGPKSSKIVYNYPMVLENVGSNVVLPCKAIGQPRPEIYWMNNDDVISREDPRFKILPTGELLISDLKWVDMGSYKCVASNAAGRDSAGTFVYPVSKEE